MISIPKMSLPELLRNSPWRRGFGRVVQEYNLAAPVLNSRRETGRGCVAGAGTRSEPCLWSEGDHSGAGANVPWEPAS